MNLKDRIMLELESISKYRRKNSLYPKLGLQNLDIDEDLLCPYVFDSTIEDKQPNFSLILAGYSGKHTAPVRIIFEKPFMYELYIYETSAMIYGNDEEKYKDTLDKIYDYANLVKEMSKLEYTVEGRENAFEIFKRYLTSTGQALVSRQ